VTNQERYVRARMEAKVLNAVTTVAQTCPERGPVPGLTVTSNTPKATTETARTMCTVIQMRWGAGCTLLTPRKADLATERDSDAEAPTD
jgi:hypothetical protein